MCIVALALGAHSRYPLVIASNRDEFYARPTRALDWWLPATAVSPAQTSAAATPLRAAGASTGPSTSPILSGRDLQAGGTWMGLTAFGRLALLTNIRGAAKPDPAAPSRGQIVTDWLAHQGADSTFWSRLAARPHNGYNLLAADVAAGAWFWASNTSAAPLRLGPGLYGLSNAALDTPWPKVTALKARLAAALERSSSVDALAAALFEALADRTVPADPLLPDTGVGLEAERLLGSAFIDMPVRGYGTRCSTLLITERGAGGERTHVLERSFDGNRSGASSLRRTVLDEWPLRVCHAEDTQAPAPSRVFDAALDTVAL